MKHILLLCTLLTLLQPHPTFAHNGAVAIAVPVEGITVDGDLSDWPEGMREYPIELPEAGVAPKDSLDFQGAFRIGYNSEENALYVAVEVQDESVVIDDSAGTAWDSKDGCEVYVDVGHGKEDVPVIQYAVRGNIHTVTVSTGERGWKNVEVEVQRSVDAHRYEWRIDLGGMSDGKVELTTEMLVGLDVVVCDKDEDGSFSWMAWGSETDKFSSEKVGFAVLREETALGKIKGRIKWEDMEEGTRLGKIRIQSLESEELWVEVKTDQQGNYEVELPAGQYQVEAGYRRRNTQNVEVNLKAGGEIWVKEIFFARPPLGRKVKAGDGKGVPAGRGKGVWQVLDMTDGLAGEGVRVISEDRSRNIWFGTESGLSRYDGQRFTTFTTKDGLVHHGVRSAFRDREGNLWFGTEGGISRYNGEIWTTYTVEDGLAGNHVWAIIQDNEGNLWFGTRDGVSKYDGKTFRSFTIENGLAGNEVLTIFQDSEGFLWFGTSSGLSKYDGKIFTTFTTQDGLSSNAVWSTFQDNEGNLWFGTSGGGVSQYDGKTWTTFTINGAGFISSILQDREGYLWFGTRGGGVSRYDGHSFTTFTVDDGLAGNFVWSIFQDHEGTLWFGSEGGVTRYDGYAFTTFTTKDGLMYDSVLRILQDREGNLWFSTESGVTRYDGKIFTTFTIEDGLPSSHVVSICQDQAGNLWFGTYAAACRYDGETFTIFTAQDGLGAYALVSIVEDGEGNLWFGGESGGVSRYDGKTFTTFTTQDGLGANTITSIVEDGGGNLWFGCKGGVSRYDGDTFTTFATYEGMDITKPLFQDHKGDLWFNVKGGGVSRYDGDTFTTFTRQNGFPHDWVSSMFQDQEGHLWFATGGGVSRYDGHAFQTLTRQDGLGSNSVSSVFQDQDGHFWFGTKNGVTRYRPPMASPPAIFIDAVVADGRHEVTKEVIVPSSRDLIAFEFHGLSIKTRPDAMVFRYRLIGYDKDWQTTHQRRVEYENLKRGSYTFKVIALDRDLVYSEEPAEVRLMVHPPYGIIVLTGGLGFALVGLVLVSGYAMKRRRDARRAERALMQELEEELQTAHDLQMGLMPTEPPTFEGFDISGRCLPANHVGGDFFQYFPVSDNRLAISLADVTGHAMEAAVPVMMFSGILDTQMETDDSLENLFAKLNRSLHRNLDKRTFVCFAMGELDTDTKEFRLSNGGCPYPYHFQSSTGEISELQVDAYPLGVRAETSYPVIETQLGAGDRIVFCSDGIIEAENSTGEIFGFERTAETIRNGCSQDLTAPQLLDYLINEVKQFTREAPQGDDQTVVVLQVES